MLFFYVQNEISVKMFLRWLWLSFHAVLHRRHAPKRLARLRHDAKERKRMSEWAIKCAEMLTTKQQQKQQQQQNETDNNKNELFHSMLFWA